MKGARVKTGGMSMGSSTRTGITNSPPGKQKKKKEISVHSTLAACKQATVHDQLKQSKNIWKEI